MAATGTPTPNIGLRIPLGTDPASVDDINYNSNLIDSKLGAVGNDSVQDQIDSLSENLAYSDNEEDLSVNIAANSVGLLVNRSLSGIVPSGKTIKAITDVYCPGVPGYVCPAIGDNGTNLIIRGLNINNVAVTVTKIKYRVWYK